MLEAGDAELPGDYRDRLEAWDVRSPVLKLNLALRRFPTFTAAAANGVRPERAMVTITDGIDAAQEAVEAARRGEPAVGFCELYFQSAYDDSVAPPGREVMSVFCQYVPYELADGDWDSRRDEIADLVLDAIEAHAPDVRDCIEEVQALGPPDIEERIGLSGGHIFQGQVLPGQMWDRRLAARTPIDGLLPVRRRHPPRRLGHRAQRANCRHGGARGLGSARDEPPPGQPDLDPAVHRRDRLPDQLERRLDAVLPGALRGLPGPRPGAARRSCCRARSSRSRGSCSGGVGWQGIIPSRAAKMGSIAVDKGIAKLGSPSEFYEQLEPEKIAEHILATARDDIRERRRADHGARAPAALARPAAAGPRGASTQRVQEQLPEIVRDGHRRDRRRTSTSCSTSS